FSVSPIYMLIPTKFLLTHSLPLRAIMAQCKEGGICRTLRHETMISTWFCIPTKKGRFLATF
uniref:hypothetical protein n=1 Tax=Candidatus Limisoma sp. TaxID=3076476 RepID=UPI004029A00E